MPDREPDAEGYRPGADLEPDLPNHPAPEVTRGRYLLLLSVGALGIVYGDIGTSPLYASRESFHAAEGLAVNTESVFGILSLMFWALVLIVSIKYLIFVMKGRQPR
ncbi:MAG: KUP/HAK/KT family potassium transporter [Acidimicrobiia bacterium]